MHKKTLEAFNDELEKIAVSPKWIDAHMSSYMGFADGEKRKRRADKLYRLHEKLNDNNPSSKVIKNKRLHLNRIAAEEYAGARSGYWKVTHNPFKDPEGGREVHKYHPHGASKGQALKGKIYLGAMKAKGKIKRLAKNAVKYLKG